MTNSKALKYALNIALLSVAIGLIMFTLSWNLFEYFEGPMPGYNVVLFPANLSLVYVWHPLFTEEVNLFPKLGLMMIGQFVFTYVLSLVALTLIRYITKNHTGVKK